ncbi:hypothetical protein HDV05_001808 [Chytridiales sp. JEL 0842]|nr:hypothetical protein HDV05_001808 [Chytridiales sp. JEL 0842]
MEDGKSKLSFVWGLLRKLSGVKDIASVRMSLPANLLTPESNLQFWNYNDRPDLFACISEPEDPTERMLRVLRWFLAKDTKWKNNELRKPYNPVLGEYFKCHWEIPNASVPTFVEDQQLLKLDTEPSSIPPPPSDNNNNVPSNVTSKDTDSMRSGKSGLSSKTLSNTPASTSTIRINAINEQILHHPPVSAFYYRCPSTGVVARGVDHVTAKFTGTNIKVGAGEYNQGVYVLLEQRDHEEYRLTYPWASINGWLSGKPYITVSETTVIYCPKTKLKCVILYKDEPYFTSPKFAIEGKIYTYDPAAECSKSHKELKDSERLSKIPEKDVVATIRGSWNGQVFVTLVNQKEKMLFDMSTSSVAEKLTTPIEEQEPNESKRLWKDVTTAILSKDFSLATTLKRQIEDEQRKKAQESKEPYQSRFFEFEGGAVPLAELEKRGVDVMERGKPRLKSGVEL